MFEYKYDFQFNRITATVKPIYILAFVAIGSKLLEKKKTNTIQNVDFDKSVKKHIKKYGEGKINKSNLKRLFYDF